jgi:hypothetical protein
MLSLPLLDTSIDLVHPDIVLHTYSGCSSLAWYPAIGKVLLLEVVLFAGGRQAEGFGCGCQLTQLGFSYRQKFRIPQFATTRSSNLLLQAQQKKCFMLSNPIRTDHVSIMLNEPHFGKERIAGILSGCTMQALICCHHHRPKLSDRSSPSDY